MRLLFAHAAEDTVLKRFVDCLNNYGVNVETFDIKRTRISALEALDNEHYDVCIIDRMLESRNKFMISDFDRLVLNHEDTLFIPFLKDDLKGTDFMVSLERLGITGAIFATDGDVQNFAQIVLDKGRTKKKARIYYGIDSESSVRHVAEENEILDPKKYVEYLNDSGSGKTAKERADILDKELDSGTFAAVLRMASDSVKEELITCGGYELYFAKEIAERGLSSGVVENGRTHKKSKPVVIEKVVEKVVEKEVVKEVEKEVVRFVDVGELTGVIGLTEEAGTTFVALNLCKGLALNDITPMLIQLPGTESDIYDRFDFKTVFGADFTSHFSEIDRGEAVSEQSNIFEGINFCVPNPITDWSVEENWSVEKTHRLFLGLGKYYKVIDFGSYYDNDDCAVIIPYLKNLIVVLDSECLYEQGEFEGIRKLAQSRPDMNIKFVSDRGKIENFEELTGFESCYTLNSVNFNNGDSDLNGIKDTSVAALPELIGYKPAEPVISKDTSNKEEVKEVKSLLFSFRKNKNKGKIRAVTPKKKTSDFTIEIGIAAVSRGVGCTHFAMQLAHYLSKNHKVAIVEQNRPYVGNFERGNNAFANIYRTIFPKKNFNGLLTQMFSYNGIDFFPFCNYTKFVTGFRDNYDYVIVDFGSEVDSNFFKMNQRIVVASGSEWKLPELDNFLTNVAFKNSIVTNISYVFPMLPASRLGEMAKRCSSVGGKASIKAYSTPLCPDWRTDCADISVIYEDICRK